MGKFEGLAEVFHLQYDLFAHPQAIPYPQAGRV
jgi:hypothetical protein